MPHHTATGGSAGLTPEIRRHWAESLHLACATTRQHITFPVESRAELPSLDTGEAYDSAWVNARLVAEGIHITIRPLADGTLTTGSLSATVSRTDGGYLFVSLSQARPTPGGTATRHLNFGGGNLAPVRFQTSKGHQVAGDKFDRLLALVAEAQGVLGL